MSVSSLSAKSSMESLRASSPAPSVASVPDSLPPAVTGPMVWSGSELKHYVIELITYDIEAIRYAVASYKLTGLHLSSIQKSTFHLPEQLAAKLSGISEVVHNGLGVAVLRGLDKARLNGEEAVIAFAGICSYVAPLRATDSYANQTLSHVRDATHDKFPLWAKDIGLPGSKLPSAMDFHSDRFSGDILALHVRNDGGPGDGGEQYLASFWEIYNTLLEAEPAVLETLAASDWPFELKQKDAAPYLELSPLLFFSKGKPIIQLVKAPLLGSPHIPRDPNMPTLSASQVHALAVVEDLARRCSAKLDRQQGDIQFVNNLSIMHARSAYGKKNGRSTRHLLRMFLRDPENAWEKPKAWSKKFDDPFTPGRRQELPVVDLDPHRKTSGRDSHG